jgi:hypothetical protein
MRSLKHSGSIGTSDSPGRIDRFIVAVGGGKPHSPNVGGEVHSDGGQGGPSDRHSDTSVKQTKEQAPGRFAWESDVQERPVVTIEPKLDAKALWTFEV